MNLSDVIICSDFDGTISGMPTDGAPFVKTPLAPICQKNIDAINDFASDGGRFVVVSGRSALTMQFVYDYIAADDLIAGTNAAMIYSSANHKAIALHPMRMSPLLFWQRLKPVADLLPEAYLTDCDARQHDFLFGRDNPDEFFGSIPAALKIVFNQHDENKMRRLKSELCMRLSDMCDIVLSAPFLVECCDKDGGKDEMIRFLKDRSPDKTIVALGDYENDIKMLKAADLAFCPQNSAPGVKSVCLKTFGLSGDGFIRDVTDYLKTL